MRELLAEAKRDRQLRRHRCVLVLEHLCAILDDIEPKDVKELNVALLLDINRKTVSRALDLLTAHHYLTLHSRDGRGVGAYTLRVVRRCAHPYPRLPLAHLGIRRLAS